MKCDSCAHVIQGPHLTIAESLMQRMNKRKIGILVTATVPTGRKHRREPRPSATALGPRFREKERERAMVKARVETLPKTKMPQPMTLGSPDHRVQKPVAGDPLSEGPIRLIAKLVSWLAANTITNDCSVITTRSG